MGISALKAMHVFVEQLQNDLISGIGRTPTHVSQMARKAYLDIVPGARMLF